MKPFCVMDTSTATVSNVHTQTSIALFGSSVTTHSARSSTSYHNTARSASSIPCFHHRRTMPATTLSSPTTGLCIDATTAS